MAKATNSPPPIVFLLSILVFSLLISVNKIDAASKSVNKEKIEFLKSKAKIRVADSRIEDEVEHEFDDDQLSTRIPKLGFNFTLPNITRQGDLGNLSLTSLSGLVNLPYLLVFRNHAVNVTNNFFFCHFIVTYINFSEDIYFPKNHIHWMDFLFVLRGRFLHLQYYKLQQLCWQSGQECGILGRHSQTKVICPSN